jgi:hypothetical protein
LAWFVLALLEISGKQPLRPGFDPNRHCTSTGVSCGVVTGVVTPWLTLAVTTFAFLVWRRQRVVRPYLKRALKSPQDVVPTAAGNTEKVVGRDALCEVTIEDLRGGDSRPRVIVGGVGTGKTAVLQRLAQMLADRGAVPVAIGLRDAKDGRIDFYEMAHTRFVSQIAWRAGTSAEAERVWHTLSQDGRIVVLADGLEEALADPSKQHERDNEIRRAIEAARDRRLRLVIASRPHDPLRGMKANITELEPLSEEAALEYIGAPHHDEDARRLDWIVETAEVALAPLYLDITRDLHNENRLQFLSPTELEPGILDSRSADTSALRWRLFETWRDALEKGHLRPSIPLEPKERQWTLEHLSALACVGLLQDSLVVKYQDLVGGVVQIARGSATGQPCETRKHGLYTLLSMRVAGLSPRPVVDVRLAATYAAQLGLVELYGESLRFRHSLVQAYLGSRYLVQQYLGRQCAPSAATNKRDQALLATALTDPGRELLVALVLRSRHLQQQRLTVPEQSASPNRERVPPSAVTVSAGGAGEESPRAARTFPPEFATPAPPRPSAGASTPGMVAGSGSEGGSAAEIDELTRALLDKAREGPRDVTATRGGTATELAKKLDIFAAAFEVDRGARGELHANIVAALQGWWGEFESHDVQVQAAKRRVFAVWGEALRGIAKEPNGLSGSQLLRDAYHVMFHLACREGAYGVRVDIAQTIGRGGSPAYAGVCADLGDSWSSDTVGVTGSLCLPDENGPGGTGGSDTNEVGWRRRIVAAWVVPMLAGSVDDDDRRLVCQQLEAAISHVGDHTNRGDTAVLPLSQEIALAQGFKHAANRRLRSPRRRAAVRALLSENALEMLKRSRYWFTQLTLIQALALWAMPDGDSAANADHEPKANPDALVRRWLDAASSVDGQRRAGDQHLHPLVIRAAELATLALELEEPERFIWIDESGVVSRVGSQPANRGHRMHGLWIPPSTGWSSLHPEAQKLVADVLVLQNLADRGAPFNDRERYLVRAHKSTLPLCMVHDRNALHIERSIGAAAAAPGSNCLDGCTFELCPYPAKGTSHTVEIPEAFCRNQRARLDRRRWPGRRTANWQALSIRDVRRFWEDMEARARR